MKIKIFCHKKPERTFKIGNWYFPICSRCTGLLFGALMYFISLFLYPYQYPISSFLIGIIFIIPILWDGVTQLFGFRVSNNFLRFTTGVIGGFGFLTLSEFINSFIIFNLTINNLLF